MKVIAIVQARMGSTRLPGKVLMSLAGNPMLLHILNRLKHARQLTSCAVATTSLPHDRPIRDLCRSHGFECFAGHETDVLDRYYQAGIAYRAEVVVRITGDCPLVDPRLVDRAIEHFKSGDYDHVGIATGAGAVDIRSGRFPDGLDVECIAMGALAAAWQEATHQSDREHVTPYIWRMKNRFRTATLFADGDYSHHRWTVDNADDLELIRAIYDELYTENEPFYMADVLAYLDRHPEVASINRDWVGREHYHAIAHPEDHGTRGDS